MGGIPENTSPAAFAAFVEANLERAHRFAWRLLGGDGEAARDVVQDAFVRARHGLAGFRGEASLETWFFRILLHEAHSHRRRRWVRLRWWAPATAGEQVAGPRVTGDVALRSRLVAAMRRLGGTQREVFVLVHLEGFTVKECAAVLGKAEGTVKTHLHRALQKLRADLADLEPEALR
jgi:RNA polymerase sigma-70 factor (ECF subfamily)